MENNTACKIAFCSFISNSFFSMQCELFNLLRLLLRHLTMEECSKNYRVRHLHMNESFFFLKLVLFFVNWNWCCWINDPSKSIMWLFNKLQSNPTAVSSYLKFKTSTFSCAFTVPKTVRIKCYLSFQQNYLLFARA